MPEGAGHGEDGRANYSPGRRGVRARNLGTGGQSDGRCFSQASGGHGPRRRRGGEPAPAASPPSMSSLPSKSAAHCSSGSEGTPWPGFVMSRTNLQELRARLTSIASEILGDCQPARVLKIDAETQPTDLMGETYRSLTTLEPFGFGNPKPVFLARRMKIQQTSRVGSEGQHLRLKLWDGRASWTAFAFRQGDIELPETGYLDLALLPLHQLLERAARHRDEGGGLPTFKLIVRLSPPYPSI